MLIKEYQKHFTLFCLSVCICRLLSISMVMYQGNDCCSPPAHRAPHSQEVRNTLVCKRTGTSPRTLNSPYWLLGCAKITECLKNWVEKNGLKSGLFLSLLAWIESVEKRLKKYKMGTNNQIHCYEWNEYKFSCVNLVFFLLCVVLYAGKNILLVFNATANSLHILDYNYLIHQEKNWYCLLKCLKDPNNEMICD